MGKMTFTRKEGRSCGLETKALRSTEDGVSSYCSMFSDARATCKVKTSVTGLVHVHSTAVSQAAPALDPGVEDKT